MTQGPFLTLAFILIIWTWTCCITTKSPILLSAKWRLPNKCLFYFSNVFQPSKTFIQPICGLSSILGAGNTAVSKKKNPHPLKAYILGEGGRQYIHSLYINMTFQRTIWGHQIGLLDEDFWGLLGQGKLFEEVNYEVMEMRCRGRPL